MPDKTLEQILKAFDEVIEKQDPATNAVAGKKPATPAKKKPTSQQRVTANQAASQKRVTANAAASQKRVARNRATSQERVNAASQQQQPQPTATTTPVPPVPTVTPTPQQQQPVAQPQPVQPQPATNVITGQQQPAPTPTPTATPTTRTPTPGATGGPPPSSQGAATNVKPGTPQQQPQQSHEQRVAAAVEPPKEEEVPVSEETLPNSKYDQAEKESRAAAAITPPNVKDTDENAAKNSRPEMFDEEQRKVEERKERKAQREAQREELEPAALERNKELAEKNAEAKAKRRSVWESDADKEKRLDEEKEQRLEAIERGEESPALKNAGGMWKREYDRLQAERKERDEAKYAADPESRPKGFKQDFADRQEARREKTIASATEKRQKQEQEQEKKLERITQNATLDAAVRRGSIDKDTKKTLKGMFGTGFRGSNKDRAEGNRDLVNRLVTSSESSDIIGTEQGKKWIQSLADNQIVSYEEGDDNYGLRVPTEESYKENQEIWNQVLSPEEKKVLGDTYQEGDESTANAAENTTQNIAVNEEEVAEQEEAGENEVAGEPTATNIITGRATASEGTSPSRTPSRPPTPGSKDGPTSQGAGFNVQGGNPFSTSDTDTEPEAEPETEPETEAEENTTEYTERNFGRTTVREEQNQALKELSSENVINSETQSAISSFINDASDKSSARNELQQHMEEFGTDKEKWNEWATEQQAGQKNFTRMPTRGRQDKAIRELPEETQSVLKDIMSDKGTNETEARGFIQRLMDEFQGDSSQWAGWLEQYQENDGQTGAYENALNVSERTFASSGDGEVTKFAKGIINRFDSVIKSFSPKADVEPKTIPTSLFYKEVGSSDLVINDKVDHIVNGLDDFIEVMDVEKPPLSINLFEKQVALPDAGTDVSVNRLGESRPSTPTASQAAARPSVGHKGVPGKWSGSHLVPMYRTVHRKKPRELILRAIRWVNPKNFFTATNGKAITELSDDEWREMDRDELIKNITTLNEYREESLVISNRYNQMIALIDQGGQTPYSILWDDKDKWMTLTDRLDRAKGLREGTAQWENQLDKTALQLRKILGEEQFNTEDGQKSHFGMIDELFDEEKGRIPFFKDPSKGRRGEKPSEDDRPWLRRTRGTGQFGQPEEDRRIIAEDAEEGIRAARYQLPSRRETLNPTEQEVRSDEFIEIMRQAPIYEGVRLPSEEQLRSEGRFEMSPERIREIAPTYTRPEETPFLRTVNNPLGQWQEEAGVDATMVRSTRFVAESLKLTRSAEVVASQRRHDTHVNAQETRTREGIQDFSQETLNTLNPQALISALEQARWFLQSGQLFVISHDDPPEPFEPGEVLVRVPPVEGAAENANTAWTIDRELHLNSSPTAHLYPHEGNVGYFMESKTSVNHGGEMIDEEVQELFGVGADDNQAEHNQNYRKSFYKMMLLDLMCGNKMGKGANTYIRTDDGMGFDETASNTNQWHGVVQEFYFSSKDGDGNNQLFPWNIFEETRGMAEDARTYGFEGKMLPVQMPEGYESSDEIDYKTEITEIIESSMPTLNTDSDDFTRQTSNEDNDDLWFDLANRIGNPDRYDELKTTLVNYMRKQMQDPTLTDDLSTQEINNLDAT